MKWLLFLLIPSLHAAELKSTETIIQSAHIEAKIPAIGVVAFNSDKTSTLIVSGTTRSDQETKATQDSVWHIGSDAKAMTATLMAVLVEKKRLNWDTQIKDIFPKLADEHDPGANTNIIQLLSHTAGLPANPEPEARKLTRRDMVELGLNHKPTGEFLYSNLGYIIAGAAIEELLDTTWEKAIQEHLFTPLGIKSVGFGPPKGPNVIHGHHNGKPLVQDNPPMYGPAGGLHLTLSDWVLFCQDQIKGHHGNGKLLTQASYQKLHTPIIRNYALGWGTRSKNGKTISLSHDGSNTMWYARARLDLEAKNGYLVTLNTADPKAVAWIPKIAKSLESDPK